MDIQKLNEELDKFLNEAQEKTFADWFGQDLTGQTYKGNIDCSDRGLTSLKGAPEIVDGNFDCGYNYHLTSLENAPRIVKGNFKCNVCPITSLKGAPEIVNGSFRCSNNNLTSLEGAPRIIKGHFNCSNSKLTTLKGAPEIVKGNFECDYNNLTSLEGAPKEVGGNFNCESNQLITLKGAPQQVNGYFDCGGNKLTTLEGAPEKVKGDFICRGNKLTSLQGAPEIVGGHFDCGGNFIDSLEKALKEIGKSYEHVTNELRTAKDARNFINRYSIVEDELHKRHINYKIRSEKDLKFYELTDFDNIDFYLRPVTKGYHNKKIPELYIQFNYRTPETFKRLKYKNLSDYSDITRWRNTYFEYKNKLFNCSNEEALKNYTKEFLDFYLPIVKQEKPTFEDDYIVATKRSEGFKRTYTFGKKFKTIEDIKNAFGQAYDYIMKNEVDDLQDPLWEPYSNYWGPHNILKFGPMYYDKEEGLSSKEDFINYNLDYIKNTFYNGSSDTEERFFYKKSGQIVLG